MIALCAGTTGLIGSQLLTLLLEDNYYSKVIALSRKALPFQHPMLDNVIVDFDKLNDLSSRLRADDVYCCLGTTIKVAGTREAFAKVDRDYPLALAQAAKDQGAKQFLIVTAQGASKNSLIFYNRVKGEVEEKLSQMGYDSLQIFQPSLLMGPRIEHRAGEKTTQQIMGAMSFMIPSKYKPIESIRVARAMVSIAKKKQRGVQVHGSAELQGY